MATSDNVNTNSTQMGATGPICPAAARNSQDRQASIDQGGSTWDSSPTLLPAASNTLSPLSTHSTDSFVSFSTSAESLMPSQSEESETRGRNQESSRMTTEEDDEQQLAPALTHENMAIDVPGSSTETNSSMLPAAPGASSLAEVKSTNKGPVVIHPSTGIEVDCQDGQSSSTRQASPAALNTFVARGNGQYNEPTTIEMITHRGPLATNTISPIPVTRSTIPTPSIQPNPSLRSQDDNSEDERPRSAPIATGDDVELGMPALAHANIVYVAPSITDAHSSTSPPAPGPSSLTEVEGTNEESALATDDGVDVDTHNDQSSSTKKTEQASLETASDTVAAGSDSPYNDETRIEQRGTLAHDTLLAMGVGSMFVVAPGEAEGEMQEHVKVAPKVTPEVSAQDDCK
ncbi:hypothetical protein BDP27DRAFT_250709 [Rhodocollybia butyracea]|uniref:Uncharacterized protein n=1 Tax=Rhodocollybia butyracea TaxID=206335 RepID=A0A9P5PH49_9AGAR|nr:hypothetical protein BDP27DRAFT_250709 [Rhodocollybia butyracea]